MRVEREVPGGQDAAVRSASLHVHRERPMAVRRKSRRFMLWLIVLPFHVGRKLGASLPAA
jgi:hypothetical protein